MSCLSAGGNAGSAAKDHPGRIFSSYMSLLTISSQSSGGLLLCRKQPHLLMEKHLTFSQNLLDAIGSFNIPRLHYRRRSLIKANFLSSPPANHRKPTHDHLYQRMPPQPSKRGPSDPEARLMTIPTPSGHPRRTTSSDIKRLRTAAQRPHGSLTSCNFVFPNSSFQLIRLSSTT